MSSRKPPPNPLQNNPLIKKLTKSNSLDKEFIRTLKTVLPELGASPSENFCVMVGKILVQKVSQLNSVRMRERTIKTQSGHLKTIKEFCLDLILDIFVAISSRSLESAVHRILEIFLNHFERHPLCHDSLALFLKWVHFSAPALATFRDKLLLPMALVFERRVREVLKKLPDNAKREELALIYKKSITEKHTFEDNLSDFLKKTFPNVLSSDRFNNRQEEEPHKDASLAGPPRASNDNSFFVEPPAGRKVVVGGPKKVVIPLLNLPTATNKDSNPLIISRSTRRNEMLNKSSVSASNRLANQVSGELHNTQSREPSLRDRRISLGGPQDANVSYMDEQPEPYAGPEPEVPADHAESLGPRHPHEPRAQNGRVLPLRRPGLSAREQAQEPARRSGKVHRPARRNPGHRKRHARHALQARPAPARRPLPLLRRTCSSPRKKTFSRRTAPAPPSTAPSATKTTSAPTSPTRRTPRPARTPAEGCRSPPSSASCTGPTPRPSS